LSEGAIEVDGRRVELSRLDKVLFPADGITKGDLVEYYHRISAVMLPHLAGRPLTLHRFPDGLAEEGFFQKNAPDHFPPWIRRLEVPKEDGCVRHALCDDAATLVYLADQACITLHPWLSREERLECPDRMIFDLDPADSDDTAGVRRAVRAVGDALRELGLRPFLATTGSRGFHVVVPLEPAHPFDTVRRFAHDLAALLSARDPDRLTVAQRKADRGRRVFVDYLRNGWAQTAVAPYSVRARPGAPVATPVDWEELPGLGPRAYSVRNLFRRLGQRDDPWREIGVAAQRLETARRKLDDWRAASEKG
jgi:bifunctional non-homologous end joining protein LigD